MGGEGVDDAGPKLAADGADTDHVAQQLLLVVLFKGEEGAEVGEDDVVAGGGVGLSEDGNHLETLPLEVVVVAEASRGVTPLDRAVKSQL